MAASVTDQLADVHPKMLAVGGEGDRKKLADPRQLVARLVSCALAILGLTQQEAAFAMGYRDQGPVSRWCSGVERPLFDKLLLLDGFAEAWLIALAKLAGVPLETVITVRRRA